MGNPLNILILEDNPADAALAERELRKAGLEFSARVAENKEEFIRSLAGPAPDIVLADYSLPAFDAMSALAIVRERFPFLPLIIVSGAIGEEVAIEALRGGATDYVLKHRLNRLGPVVRRAIHETEQLTERRRAEVALRESEERFRVIVEAVQDYAIFMLDPAGNVVSWNAGAERIKGYEAGEIVGRNFSIFYPPDDLAPGKPQSQLATAARNGRMEDEGWRLRKDGSRFWAHVVITALCDEAGRLRGFAKITRDATERKRADEALRELNAALERRVAERTSEVRQQADQLRALAAELTQAEQRERKRLAGILHDHIQQLLVAARMQVECLKRAGEPEQRTAAVSGVDGILKEALEASRSLAIELSPPVLREAGLIGGLNWLAVRMLEKHQFKVHLRADSKAEPAAEDARFLLFECVRELLFNAVKHAGVSEAHITLLRTRDESIKLIVHDQGIGFDPDLLKKRRAEEASFGLFSVQQRLAHIGGNMEIATAPGKGTTVTLTIPVAETQPRPKASEEALRTKEKPDKVVVREKTSACRILIVDDHRIVREGLAGLMQFEPDIEVVGQAADGPQAIELAGKLEPDVIIMDVNLGNMSGVEATKRILARNPNIKVIALSMHANSDVAGIMRSAGACAFLTKGGPVQDLLNAIRVHAFGTPDRSGRSANPTPSATASSRD